MLPAGRSEPPSANGSQVLVDRQYPLSGLYQGSCNVGGLFRYLGRIVTDRTLADSGPLPRLQSLICV
jgi:hypothetical protein